MQRWIFGLGLQVLMIVLTAVMACNVTANMQPDRELSPHQFKSMLDRHRDNPDVVLLDIRTPGEFRQGHIHGARLVDYYDRVFMATIGSLDRQKTYLIYCRSGNRTGKSLKLFDRLGFTQVYHLKSGLVGWLREKYPLDN